MPITETFFPAFLKACDDDPNDILVIQLKCGICHEQMTLEDGADLQLPPCEKGSLIHRDEGKSIALIEDILKLRRNRWYCFNCDADAFTTWLQMVMKISMDCTDVVNDGQFLRICVEYEVFNYEIRLYELRDKQDIFLVWERRHIEKMKQEIRDNWLGSRKLMVLDLAYDLRDLWSDENVRRKKEEQVESGKRSMMDYIDDVEEAARDDEDEEPDVYVV
ncbi:hypothetical protein F25303_11457 [Fusarium sp. NRRL 25303]|nr:hypothetical protein F25303_11457 [Fusarium sp. NRRL 25303]